MRDRARELGAVVWGCVLFIVALALIGSFFLVSRPGVLAWEREAVVQSQSYTDSRQRELLLYLEEYHSLNVQALQTQNPEAVTAYRSQQQALVSRMRQAASTMPRQNVPPEVARVIGY